MRIRSMSLEDYEAVYQLWLDTPGMGLNDLDDSRPGIARYLERNPTSTFVAEREGRIVGVILSGHDGRRGSIYHLAVGLAHRGQGIGAALVRAALAALEAHGIHKVGLLVFSRNEIGNRFWERNGFTVRQDLIYRNKSLHEMKRIDT